MKLLLRMIWVFPLLSYSLLSIADTENDFQSFTIEDQTPQDCVPNPAVPAPEGLAWTSSYKNACNMLSMAQGSKAPDLSGFTTDELAELLAVSVVPTDKRTAVVKEIEKRGEWTEEVKRALYNIIADGMVDSIDNSDEQLQVATIKAYGYLGWKQDPSVPRLIGIIAKNAYRTNDLPRQLRLNVISPKAVETAEDVFRKQLTKDGKDAEWEWVGFDTFCKQDFLYACLPKIKWNVH